MSSLTGCSKDECLVGADFVYYNKSGFEIATPDGRILDIDSLILSIRNTKASNCEGSLAESFFPLIGDGGIVFLNDTVCTSLNEEDEGPLKISNYTVKELKSRLFGFEYIFTEEQYNRSIPCGS